MTLLRRPYMQTANAHLLPIDRNHPTLSLYLPLWYPHGDMTGSPIYSYDKNRHVGTVTGATWGYQGRTFDGADDVITITDAASIQNIFDSPNGGTVMAWINPDSDGEADGGTIVNKSSDASSLGWRFYVSGEVAGIVKLTFWCYFSLTSQLWSTNATAIPINTWSHVAVTYTATAGVLPKLYVNGALEASGTAVTTGTRKSDVGVNMEIGDWAEVGRAFDGGQGELLLYKARTLSGAQILNNYLSTKWRY